MHTMHFAPEVQELQLNSKESTRNWQDTLIRMGAMPPTVIGDALRYYSALQTFYISLDSGSHSRIATTLSQVDRAATGVIVGGKSVQVMFPAKELLHSIDAFPQDDWVSLVQQTRSHVLGLVGFLTPFLANADPTK